MQLNACMCAAVLTPDAVSLRATYDRPYETASFNSVTLNVCLIDLEDMVH